MTIKFKEFPTTQIIFSGGAIGLGIILNSWGWVLIGLLGFILFEDKKNNKGVKK